MTDILLNSNHQKPISNAKIIQKNPLEKRSFVQTNGANELVGKTMNSNNFTTLTKKSSMKSTSNLDNLQIRPFMLSLNIFDSTSPTMGPIATATTTATKPRSDSTGAVVPKPVMRHKMMNRSNNGQYSLNNVTFNPKATAYMDSNQQQQQFKLSAVNNRLIPNIQSQILSEHSPQQQQQQQQQQHLAAAQHQGHPKRHWPDDSNSGWTSTGVMSDRSSVYSIDDGDFNREASSKVNRQLKEIEAILYEQNTTHSSNLTEYKEWRDKFPHLRLLGTSLLKEHIDFEITSRSSQQNLQINAINNNYLNTINNNNNNNNNNVNANFNDNYFNYNISSSFPPIGNSVQDDPSSKKIVDFDPSSEIKFSRRRENTDLINQGLNLNGKSMPIRKLHESECDNEANSYLQEEIFEEEGVYEEVFAYDNQEEEYLVEHNKRLNLNKRRRHGLPPITPKAAMRDLVNNFLFDYMWSEVIEWSSGLIKEYAKTIAEAEMNFESLNKSNETTNGEVNTQTQDLINRNQQQQQQQSTWKLVQSNTIKPNIVPVKPFNPPTNNNNTTNSIGSINSNVNNTNNTVNLINNFNFSTITNNNNNNTSLVLYNSEKQQNSHTPVISRDNSTLYPQFNKEKETSLDEVPGDYKKYLHIKQINTSGNVTKSITPVVTRVGSGSRKPLTNKKPLLKSLEPSLTNQTNHQILTQSISIMGIGKYLNNEQNEKSPSNTNQSGGTTNNNIPNRSSNNSVQTYHNQLIVDENSNNNNNNNNNSNYADNDYTEYQLGGGSGGETNSHANYNEISESSIDEINLLNSNSANHGSSNKHHVHFNSSYHTNYPSYNYQPTPQQLPPISNSLKPLRISSANNLNSNKEKNERPFTSTASRIENLSNKRSTTPSGLISSNKFMNLYSTGMKVHRGRLSSDEPLYLNSQAIQQNLATYLSTKSITTMTPSNSSQQVQHRRNSIKESQSFQRHHK